MLFLFVFYFHDGKDETFFFIFEFYFVIEGYSP